MWKEGTIFIGMTMCLSVSETVIRFFVRRFPGTFQTIMQALSVSADRHMFLTFRIADDEHGDAMSFHMKKIVFLFLSRHHCAFFQIEELRPFELSSFSRSFSTSSSSAFTLCSLVSSVKFQSLDKITSSVLLIKIMNSNGQTLVLHITPLSSWNSCLLCQSSCLLPVNQLWIHVSFCLLMPKVATFWPALPWVLCRGVTLD